MDLLKTPSVSSLLDSDLESIDSFQCLDVEELDEVEYALPSSDAPTLDEALSELDDGVVDERLTPRHVEEPYMSSALQADFLQAASQQILQAEERSSAGTATTLSTGKDGKLTVGTAHGHLLSFQEQILRWVCDSNTDHGAVSCVAYNQDSTRLLAGYARGLICQYESMRGVVLRRVTLGCEIWGTLRVTWAGTSGLALDTGGSVWLIKFSRPLGVRSAKTSCLFSGARGEVVAMTARDARVLALATLSRAVVVVGGRAAGVRLPGPPDTLPVLAWCENDERVLVCARSKNLQWTLVNITGSSISLRPLQRMELKTTPLWLGWLGGSLAIFDVNENLRLWGEDYDKPLDLSNVEPVYASAFFKGLWTDGKVSQAMCLVGASALGGVCVADGALSLLGRKGVVRVKPRNLLARANAFISCCRYLQALRLLCSTKGSEAKMIADQFILTVSERPYLLSDKTLADQTVKLCLKYNLSDRLWTTLWETCSKEDAFVEALGDAAVRGDLADIPPSPDKTQELIERLADFEPGLVERVVASLPLTALDPHRASVFTRQRRLWRGVGAIAATLGGASGAMRELLAHTDPECSARRAASGGDEACACAGGALLLAAADALAGRGAGGRALPEHARPSARHGALLALLAHEYEHEANSGVETSVSMGAGAAGAAGAERSPLRALVRHDAAAAARLLEQSAHDPPFAGPLGKQNRLRVARALLAYTDQLRTPEDRIEILEFVAGQISTGALPSDQELIKKAEQLAASTEGERADRAWLALLRRARVSRDQLAGALPAAAARPRVRWRLAALLDRHEDALQEFFNIQSPSAADAHELFEYLQAKVETDADCRNAFERFLPKLIELRPRAAAALTNDDMLDSVASVLEASVTESALEFAECLLEAGRLKGEAAAAHLRNVCALRPARAGEFLARHAGAVRPERALDIVRRAGVAAAEPACLEAAGDPEAALHALLRLIAAARDQGDTEGESRLLERASALCRGASAAVPAAAAAALWRALLGAAAGSHAPPPALLLDARAYLPLDELIAKTCVSARAAQSLLECAALRRREWACAARVAGREAHERLARALRAARRGLPVRGHCHTCHRRLDARLAVRTAHCARAYHVDCEADAKCVCGQRVPEALYALPAQPGRARDLPPPPPPAAALALVAPPRPDLESVI